MAERITNRSAPAGPIVPELVYADVNRAVPWLHDAFGFEELLRWGPDDNPTVHVGIGEGAAFIRSARTGHGAAKELVLRPPRSDELSHSIMVHVDDIDPHFERAQRAGARILLPPRTYPFGERQYSALDLEGHLWAFTQSVADVEPEAWGGRRPS